MLIFSNLNFFIKKIKLIKISIILGQNGLPFLKSAIKSEIKKDK